MYLTSLAMTLNAPLSIAGVFWKGDTADHARKDSGRVEFDWLVQVVGVPALR